MKNRPVWFVLGSACVTHAVFGVAPKQSFLNARVSANGLTEEKFAIAGRARQQPRRARYLILLTALLIFAPLICFGQEVSPTPSPSAMEAEPIVVTAARFDIPLELSHASASVITSEDFEQKQIERISDALRDVTGLSVVQTGKAGQLTAVFTRG